MEESHGLTNCVPEAGEKASKCLIYFRIIYAGDSGEKSSHNKTVLLVRRELKFNLIGSGKGRTG